MVLVVVWSLSVSGFGNICPWSLSSSLAKNLFSALFATIQEDKQTDQLVGGRLQQGIQRAKTRIVLLNSN